MSSIRVRHASGVRSACAAALLSFLAACGGGGGGGGGADPIVVPDGARQESASSNSDVNEGDLDVHGDLANALVSLVASAGGSPAEGTLSPQQSGKRATALGARKTGGAPAVARLLRSVVQDLYSHPVAKAQAAKSTALALVRRDHNCANTGTWSTTTDDFDEDGLPSPGDSVSVLFDNCRVDSLALPADGGFTFIIDAVDLDNGDNIVGLVVEGTYENLSIGSAATLDGAFTAWQTLDRQGVERYRFSYANMRETLLNDTTVYNVDIDGVFESSTNIYAIDGAITLGNRTYKIVQSSDEFRADRAALPSRGSIYLEDAFGNALGMAASANERLDFSFIPADLNQPVVPWSGLSWSDFGI